jgi:hypothetical protein
MAAVHHGDSDERAEDAPNPAYRARDADACCSDRGWVNLNGRARA